MSKLSARRYALLGFGVALGAAACSAGGSNGSSAGRGGGTSSGATSGVGAIATVYQPLTRVTGAAGETPVVQVLPRLKDLLTEPGRR